MLSLKEGFEMIYGKNLSFILICWQYLYLSEILFRCYINIICTFVIKTPVNWLHCRFEHNQSPCITHFQSSTITKDRYKVLLYRKETNYSDRRFWCSYILFIIIIGGLLVLFTYITRLASNEIFSPSNKIHR